MKPLLAILSVLCLFFVTTTLILWQHQRQSDAEIIRLQNEADSRSVQENKEIQAERNAKSDSDRVEQIKLSVCGIYNQPNPGNRRLDLRSDGSVVYFTYAGGGNWYRQRSGTWTIDDADQVQCGQETFKIEGEDLIDQRGTRWLHIR